MDRNRRFYFLFLNFHFLFPDFRTDHYAIELSNLSEKNRNDDFDAFHRSAFHIHIRMLIVLKIVFESKLKIHVK